LIPSSGGGVGSGRVLWANKVGALQSAGSDGSINTDDYLSMHSRDSASVVDGDRSFPRVCINSDYEVTT
jgi:hypothetical protein